MKEAVLDRITLANVGIDLRQTANYHASLLQKGADVKGRAEEAARDLHSYEKESLEDNVFSFYPYYVHEFEGRRRIFSADEPKPEFLALSQIDSREREGAVLGGFKRIEEKIPEMGFFVWVSIDGEAGIHNIKYRYHQVYLGEINGKKIQTAALKCDLETPILSEWLTLVSKGETVLPDLSPRSFITSPVVVESEQQGVQSALRILKEVLARHNTDRFYKDVSIDDVIMNMQSERGRQEKGVQQLASELLPYFVMHGQDPRLLTQVLGGRLYDLYNKYRDSKGNISLTGCGGGTKCINELFSGGKTFNSGIFSTGSRVSEFGEQTGVMECVNCPFCNETVDAILTKSKIICPKCKKTAERSQ